MHAYNLLLPPTYSAIIPAHSIQPIDLTGPQPYLGMGGWGGGGLPSLNTYNVFEEITFYEFFFQKFI